MKKWIPGHKLAVSIEDTMDKRVITIREEKAYRLCHSDFDGLTIDDAAKQMGVSRRAVLKLLKNVERKAPQLPPVLTPQQHAVLCLLEKGVKPREISDAMNLQESNVSVIIRFLTERGFIADLSPTVGYTPGMDGRVKERL